MVQSPFLPKWNSKRTLLKIHHITWESRRKNSNSVAKNICSDHIITGGRPVITEMKQVKGGEFEQHNWKSISPELEDPLVESSNSEAIYAEYQLGIQVCDTNILGFICGKIKDKTGVTFQNPNRESRCTNQ